MTSDAPEAAIKSALVLIEARWATSNLSLEDLIRTTIEAAMPAIREAIAQEIEAGAYTIIPGAGATGVRSGRDQAARIVRGSRESEQGDEGHDPALD